MQSPSSRKTTSKTYRKVYVDVYAVMLRDGTVKPRRFLWEDGATYQIDRILHITPAASTKVGGRGIRYTVMIEGQEKYIFREDDKWFMEAPIIK